MGKGKLLMSYYVKYYPSVRTELFSLYCVVCGVCMFCICALLQLRLFPSGCCRWLALWFMFITDIDASADFLILSKPVQFRRQTKEIRRNVKQANSFHKTMSLSCTWYSWDS